MSFDGEPKDASSSAIIAQPALIGPLGARVAWDEQGLSTLDNTPTCDSGFTLSSPTSVFQAKDGASRTLEAGARFGRYVILRKIGEGAMGMVYLAHDTELERQVAIKLLRPENHRRELGIERERLLLEARNIARVHHPNIVVVHDVGEVDGRAFVAMHYVDGESLAAWLVRHDGNHDKRLSWRQIVAAYLQAAQGLAAAHRAGLIHRDFKPENAMIDAVGRVRVLDFGIATAGNRIRPPDASSPLNRLPSDLDELETLLERDSHALSTSSIAGTPAYMAPEVFLGERADARSDQFSFCVALHEALYGRRPFGQRLPTGFALATGQRVDRPATLTLCHSVPRSLQRILIRGLRTNPHNRFDSMDELVEAIQSALRARRRTVAGALVLGTAFCGAMLGHAMVQPLDHQLCKSAEHSHESAWFEAARERLHHTLNQSAAKNRVALEDRLLASFDRFSGQWSDARTQLCAAMQRGDRSMVERMSQRVAVKLDCLSGLRQSFSHFVHRITQGTTRLDPEHVVTAIESLGDVQACVRGDYDVVHDVWRHENASPDAIEVQADLERAKVHLLTKNADDAVPLAEKALEYADINRELGFAARAHLILGPALAIREEFDRAEQTLKEAILEAEESGLTRVELEAWLALGFFYQGRSDGNKAHEAATHAQALLRRTRLERTSFEVQLLRIQGFVANQRLQPSAAISAFSRALELAIHLYGPDFATIGELERLLAMAYTRAGDFAQAEPHFHRSLRILADTYGEDHRTYMGAQRVYAMALRDQERYEEALAVISSALAVERRTGEPTTELVRLLTYAGDIAFLMEHDDEALRYRQEALSIAQLLPPTVSDMMGDLHDGLGASFQVQGNYSEALHHCRLAWKIWTQIRVPTSISPMSTRACVVDGLWGTGMHRQAEAEMDELLAQVSAGANEYTASLFYLTNDVADVLENLKESPRYAEFGQRLAAIQAELAQAKAERDGQRRSNWTDNAAALPVAVH